MKLQECDSTMSTDSSVPDPSKKSKHAEALHHGYNLNLNMRRRGGNNLNIGGPFQSVRSEHISSHQLTSVFELIDSHS